MSSDYSSYFILKFFLFLLLVLTLKTTFAFQSSGNQHQNNVLSLVEQIKPRVIGGKEAPAHSAPYIVSIQQETSAGKPGVHFCGGAILNEHWILTAGHCLPSKATAQKAIIVAGAHNVQQLEKTQQTRRIDYYKVHDLYVGGTSPYDLALIYTKTPFKWDSNVKPISLPAKNSNPTGTATLFGWGSTSTTSKPDYPSNLRTVDMPIITLDECKRALGDLGYKVHTTNLCTGPLSGGKGICQADSGGPLVQSGKLIGVVSWGRTPCGQKNSPSIFVQVSAFIDWITKEQKQGPK